MNVWVLFVYFCGDGQCGWAAAQRVYESEAACQRALTPVELVSPRWLDTFRSAPTEHRCVAVRSAP